MGRGLSSLQKRILALAVTIQAEPRYHPIVPDRQVTDLFRPEMLSCLWGWPMIEDFVVRGTDGRLYVRHVWGKYFDPEEIGAEAYRSAHASLSRALCRLEKRGLIRISNCHSIALTDAGAALAAEIALDKEPNG